MLGYLKDTQWGEHLVFSVLVHYNLCLAVIIAPCVNKLLQVHCDWNLFALLTLVCLIIVISERRITFHVVIWKNIHSFTYLFIYLWVSQRFAFSRTLLEWWLESRHYRRWFWFPYFCEIFSRRTSWGHRTP